MARSRSRRRSTLRRVVLPISAIGLVVFVGYLLIGNRDPAPADAGLVQPQQQPQEAQPSAKTAPAADPVQPPILANESRVPAGPASKPGAKGKAPLETPATQASGEARPAAAVQPPTSAVNPTTRAAIATVSAEFLNQAKALADAGKLLEARAALNNALQTGRLDQATAETTKARIRELNQTIIFTPTRRYPDDPQQSAYTIQPGDNLVKICRTLAVPYGFISRINAVQPERIRVGQSIKLIQGPIHAVVSKKHFTMDLYLAALPGQPGSMYLTTYRVGLGEDGSTPTGLWEVTKGSKTENPQWSNPRTTERFEPNDPKNPLGEHWIGLTGIAGDAVGAVSYGIHGTIEPESIGKNASMGCIRLGAEDVAALFDMLSEGRSTVLVVE